MLSSTITRHLRYSSVLVKDLIIVVDNGGNGLSVTNAAEEVVRELGAKYGLRGHRIIYRDSMGIWDELKHDGARFTGFGAIGARSVLGALAAVGK